MSDLFWKRLNHLAGFAAIGVLFGVIVLTAHLEIRDFDLWLHIGVGQFIVQNGYVPAQDILSYTIAGTPWVNHEWLFQVLAFSVFHSWGAEGLIRMQVVVVWVTLMLLLFLGYNRERQFFTVFTLLLVLLVYQTRFTIRPDIFSLLFFTIYIYLLSLHIDKKWAPFAFVVTQVLWTNMHGFFFFGPLFVLIALIGEWLRRHVRLPYAWNTTGRLTNEEYRRLKVILAAVILACLANPMTFQGAIYPLTVMFQLPQDSKIFFEYIMELQRPVEWGNLFSLNRFPFYKLLILLSAYSFVLNRRKVDVGGFLFWLVFLLFSLAALRNIVFFAFAAYLVIMTNVLTIDFRRIVPIRFLHKNFQHITETFLKIFLTLWMVAFGVDRSSGGYFDYDRFENKSLMEGISTTNYPKGAADFLVAHNIKGHIFNDFNSGAYLVGRCFPNIKVFIDGRTEVYGPNFFKNYLRIWEKQDIAFFDQVAEDYGMTLAFLNSTGEAIPPTLLRHLYTHEDWALIYFDHDGMIFAKRIPENKDLIKRLGMDLAQWPGKEMDLFRLGIGRVEPYPFVRRAFTLSALGLDDTALQQAREALKIDPGSIEAHKISGEIYGRQNDHQKAFKHFRIAAMSAANTENRLNLAQAYFNLKEYKGAIRQYETILSMEPKNIRIHFLLARAYALYEEYDKSLETIRAAYKLGPRATVDILAIAEIFEKGKKHEGAAEIYELALTVDPENAEIKKRVRKLGNIEKK